MNHGVLGMNPQVPFLHSVFLSIIKNNCNHCQSDEEKTDDTEETGARTVRDQTELCVTPGLERTKTGL